MQHSLLPSSFKRLRLSLIEFFSSYPAWGLALGALISTFFHPLYALPFCLIKKMRFYALLIFIGSSLAHYGTKELPQIEATYQGVFTPTKEVLQASFFAQNTSIKGVLKTKKGSFNVTFLKNSEREFLTQVCYLEIEVAWKDELPKFTIHTHHSLKPSPWLFVFRSKLAKHLKTLTQHSAFTEQSQLLYALFTGQIDNKLLKLQFQDHGLSHILALSGFHLNLILSFSSFILAHTLRLKYAHELGLILLSFYVLFTGIQSSIIRAYTMSLCGCLHQKRSLKTHPLHLFSLSLLITSFVCHHMSASCGFILSFSATLCLIIFPSIWDKLVTWIGETQGTWETFIYSWLKLICLQIFIFIATAPTILHFFGSLHLKSIFFNLIYPLFLSFFMMIGAALCLLKTLQVPLVDQGFYALYSSGHLLLEGIKKPLDSSSGQVELRMPSLIMIGSHALLLGVVFYSAKKNKSR